MLGCQLGHPHVVVVVAGFVADVQVQFAPFEVRNDLANGVHGLVDEPGVLREQRHADDGLEIRAPDAAQAAERLNPFFPRARQAAHLLVHGLRPVDADGNHQTADAAFQRVFDELDRLVAEPSRGWKTQQVQRPARFLNRRHHVIDVAAHEQFAARKLHPFELRPPLEEQGDFGRRHLVPALLLPDVAHLAAEVAVVGRDERDLERQVGWTNVGRENGRAEPQLSADHGRVIVTHFLLYPTVNWQFSAETV